MYGDVTLPANEKSNGSELFRWYLASLRRDAKLRAEKQSLTPLTLVERDKARIQELIAQSGKIRVGRSEEILSALKQRHAEKLAALRLVPGAGGIKRMFDEQLSATSKLIAAMDSDAVAADEASLDKLADLLIGELEEARQGERLIADYTSDLLCCLDEKRLVLEVNLEFELITGYQKLSIAAVPIDKFIAPDDLSSFIEYLDERKKRTEDSAHRIECAFRRQDGKIVYLDWRVDWSASARCYFCRAKDITERKEQQRLREQVVSVARHDIRGPLTGIGLALDNLQVGIYGTLSEAGVETVAEALASIDRMVEMVDKLIAATQKETDS
jgi:PAS domain S-box-containing protein